MRARPAKRVQGIEASATLAVAERAAELRVQGVDVVSFGAGEPDYDTPAHIKQAAVQALENGFTKYTASSGMPILRKAIARKFERDNGLAYAPDQILVSCGSKHSIYNALQALVDPGDRVLIPAPYWVSYPEMVKCAGGVPVPVAARESDGFKMKPAALKRAIKGRAKLLILCSPSNPTGIVYAPGELEALAKVLEDSDLYVISDEIYERLVYGKARHASIASFGDMKERTLVVNGVSKVFAMTGWRIGYMAGPKDVIAAAGRMQSHATSNPNSIAQYAAYAALEAGYGAADEMVAEYARRRDVMVPGLRRIPGVTCVEPEGAFYAFPNVRAAFGRKARGRLIDGSAAFAKALLEEAHVAVVPGAPFGSDEHVRLSYATSMDQIRTGLDRIAGFFKSLA